MSGSSFNRIIFLSGAAKRMLARRLLTAIFSFDFSFIAGHARLPDVLGVLAEEYGGTFSSQGRSGRPGSSSTGLGCLAVVVGRNFAGNLVLLSLALVSAENLDNAKWVLEKTEREFGLAEAFGTVNFFADRSAAISSAISTVYGEGAFRAFCYPHFKRNVINHIRSQGKDAQEEVAKHLGRCHNAKTIEDFDEAMQGFREANPMAHAYADAAGTSHWAPVHMPFNPLGNSTSNDAESMFATVRDKKYAGNAFGCIKGMLDKHSKRLWELYELFRMERELLISPVLRKAFTKLRRKALSAFVPSRSGRDVLQIAFPESPDETNAVDLTDPSNERSACDCGHRGKLPCVHTIAAVNKFEALGGDTERLFNPGALRPRDGTVAISTLRLPSTFKLRADKDVTRPLWLSAVVPLSELSHDAARDALPFRESFEPEHWSNISGARIWSSGEHATTSANFALASKNPKRQKVRVKLALTHPVASTATPTPVTFSSMAPKGSSRKCGFCKKPGHNQKTCPKKGAFGTNPNTVTLGAAVEAAASTAVADLHGRQHFQA